MHIDHTAGCVDCSYCGTYLSGFVVRICRNPKNFLLKNYYARIVIFANESPRYILDFLVFLINIIEFCWRWWWSIKHKGLDPMQVHKYYLAKKVAQLKHEEAEREAVAAGTTVVGGEAEVEDIAVDLPDDVAFFSGRRTSPSICPMTSRFSQVQIW